MHITRRAQPFTVQVSVDIDASIDHQPSSDPDKTKLVIVWSELQFIRIDFIGR